jgi:hypothetical protein
MSGSAVRRVFPLALLCVGALVTGCDGDSERPEKLDKLRGLGVQATPLVASPSVDGETPKTVELTVYASLPIGQTATVAAYADEESFLSVNTPADQIAVDEASIKYDEYPGLQIMSFKAKVPVPTASDMARFGGSGNVRYGFVLNAGDEEEKMVGNFLVYPEDAPQLAWTNPDAAVSAPIDGGTVSSGGESDLKADLADPNGEDLKVGWYVTSGEIKNRRARNTIWKEPDAGPQTVILTVRGRQSRGFAMKAFSVTAQ